MYLFSEQPLDPSQQPLVQHISASPSFLPLGQVSASPHALPVPSSGLHYRTPIPLVCKRTSTDTKPFLLALISPPTAYKNSLGAAAATTQLKGALIALRLSQS